VTKKGILYRNYCRKQNADNWIELVVPTELREKVVSLAHDTLLAGHRGAAKTQYSAARILFARST